MLNDWGAEGWEATQAYTPEGSGKVAMLARRPLMGSAYRLRTMPNFRVENAQP